MKYTMISSVEVTGRAFMQVGKVFRMLITARIVDLVASCVLPVSATE